MIVYDTARDLTLWRTMRILLLRAPSLAHREVEQLDQETGMSLKPGCIRPRRTPLQEPATAFVSMVLHG